MNWNALIVATVIGTIAQLVMIGAGHYVAFVRDNVFLLGGLAISLVAGLIYAWMAAGGWGDAFVGGALAGGICALIGIGASVALGDTAAVILIAGTLSSAVTGSIGGAIGRWLHG